MIILPIACILLGCLQDVPFEEFNRVVDNPVRAVQMAMPRKKESGPYPACYIEGVFHPECPNSPYKVR